MRQSAVKLTYDDFLHQATALRALWGLGVLDRGSGARTAAPAHQLRTPATFAPAPPSVRGLPCRSDSLRERFAIHELHHEGVVFEPTS